MTNADVENLMRYGDEVGREIDTTTARQVLSAKEILKNDPTGKYAAIAHEVVIDFSHYVSNGTAMGLGIFMLPHAETDEEITEHNRIRDAHLAGVAKNAC
jgi:hypothetical protein